MRTLLAVAVVLLVPSFLFAQSLGEVAAREKERRDKVSKGKPGKVMSLADFSECRRTRRHSTECSGRL